jgi:hypothetical protein
LDCENGQGFFFSNPLEASELDEFIASFSLKHESSSNHLAQLVQTLDRWPPESTVNPECLLVSTP